MKQLKTYIDYKTRQWMDIQFKICKAQNTVKC